jgi:alpha-1,3-rhamnosyl/mannosyltransferase
MIDALGALDVEVVEARNEGRRAPAGGGLRSALNLGADAWWQTVELPRRAREAEADLLHHPLPAWSVRAHCPQVVTVHDLAFERLPGCFDRRFRLYASAAHRAAAKRADVTIAVSETTATDAVELWGLPRERIVVARHGPGQEPAGPSRREPPEHILYVGDDEPRKNLGLLLEAHRRYAAVHGPGALPLVLAGNVAPRPGARVVQRPEPAELARLYARAVALVHPSLYEGFGLTPLEAMSAGVPVLAARSPGVVETVGDAALLFDPRDPGALADLLARIAQEPALGADLTERGRRRAAEFSWARSARAHVGAYALALTNGRAQG